MPECSKCGNTKAFEECYSHLDVKVEYKQGTNEVDWSKAEVQWESGEGYLTEARCGRCGASIEPTQYIKQLSESSNSLILPEVKKAERHKTVRAH